MHGGDWAEFQLTNLGYSGPTNMVSSAVNRARIKVTCMQIMLYLHTIAFPAFLLCNKILLTSAPLPSGCVADISFISKTTDIFKKKTIYSG